MIHQWKANKIGLVDFWYYDEQEFYFIDGKMLLRGSNGSGKSVTTQSFIPLLLDGNMRPERLDPFGSRARKMENYLLEDGDGREERTAYLYMEFKRKDSDTYITIGIGMRARVNKKLDIWYFALTDGRRVKKDFFLYKDVQNKIAYSKTELKNRIGEGGILLETQKEYAEYVNKLLFGFETMEEYKEMIELLIQLRTPKLSKDFKPTIINEILSNSLQTLSEDDLRPMSEAIENMDDLKINIDTLIESIQSVQQIEKIYAQYNQTILYQKAFAYKEENNKFNLCLSEIEELKKKVIVDEEEKDKLNKIYENLIDEEKIVKEEKSSLEKSDASKLKEEEILFQEQKEECECDIEKIELQRREKEEKRIEIEDKKKCQEEKIDMYRSEVVTLLDEMEEVLDKIPFDEFSFLKKDLLEKEETICDFKTHKQLLNGYREKVNLGIDVLKQVKEVEREYSSLGEETAKLERERDGAEREKKQRDTLFGEIKMELIEQIYRWRKQNEILQVEDSIMQQVVHFVERFEHGYDVSEMKELIYQVYQTIQEKITHECLNKRHQLELEKELLDKRKEELEHWLTMEEPEPERSQSVIENRRLLKEKGISFLPFYQAIDFTKNCTKEKMNQIEESFVHMGLLDAIIVPSTERERVLSMDKGLCDKYIFSDNNSVENALHHLEIYHGNDNIVLHQLISNVLKAIGSNNNKNMTWINEQRRYQIGVIEGIITGEYEAKFIGSSAREEYRQNEINRCRMEIEQQEEIVKDFTYQVQVLESKIEKVQKEWESIPDTKDLKVAAQSFSEICYQLILLEQQIEKRRKDLEQKQKQLDEIILKAKKICEKTYLKARLDIFEEAKRKLESYANDVIEIEVLYNKIQDGKSQINNHTEYIEALEMDLDDILSRYIRTKRQLEQITNKIYSIQEQLKLTDYDKIKERLDYCIQRIYAIPLERENCIIKKTELERDIQFNEKLIVTKQKEYEIIVTKRIALEEIFQKELQLHYVKEIEIVSDKIEEQVEQICSCLQDRVSIKKIEEVSGMLQGAFHQYSGVLREYDMRMLTLFSEYDEKEAVTIAVKRLDIQGKYRGVYLSLYDLLYQLERDLEVQSRLLSEQDRQIFEEILVNTISKKIRAKIHASRRWVDRMNEMMQSMNTSSGLKLSLRWKQKKAEKEEQLDTQKLVELLQKDSDILMLEEVSLLSKHFRSKIDEARNRMEDSDKVHSFHVAIKEILDYRKWFEFQLECQKTGEKKRELTDRIFFTFSGGEKAMAMYVPLFSAVAAKYAGGRKDSPKLISLDEAFAGVDDTNIKDMFRLMVEMEFDFMLNSQILWGDYETVPHIAIYQLIRTDNAKFVTILPYQWDGKQRILLENVEQLEKEV